MTRAVTPTRLHLLPPTPRTWAAGGFPGAHGAVKEETMARDPEKFWQLVMEHFFDHGDSELEYDTFLDYAKDCGLVTPETYSIDKHGEDIMGEPEEGDTIFVPVPRSTR